MRESIFFASIRSFFITFSCIIGLIFGLFIIAAVVGVLSITSDGIPELTYAYTAEIKPNGSGVRKVESDSTPVILQVNISGVIGLDSLKSESVAQLLIESRERWFANDRVKAILLTIDSPGGVVTDADGIYRAIKAYKEKYKVPVYAFTDGLCASGGYYVAAAADKIYSTDTCLVGSVGVIMPSVMNFSQLMEKVGVQSMTLYDGKGKDALNPFRPWHKGEEANIQASIAYYYQMFVDVVTSHRASLSKSKLVEEYGANVYPAALAKEYGYIDESGYNREKVLQELAKTIGVEDDNYQVVELENNNWLASFFRNEQGMLKGNITHYFELTPGISSQLSNQFLYLYHPTAL